MFAIICIKIGTGVMCAIGDSIRKITDRNQPKMGDGALIVPGPLVLLGHGVSECIGFGFRPVSSA
jgi:hypothetical protein